MLKGELYDIIKITREEAEVRLLASSCVYAAHFPGYPITPGVAIVKIATELLSELSVRSVDVASARNIKFLLPVIPSEDTCLTFRFGDSGAVSVLLDGNVCTTMSLKLE